MAHGADHAGTYREKVTLDVYKDKVRILGDEMAETRIVWDDYAGKVVDGASDHLRQLYDVCPGRRGLSGLPDHRERCRKVGQAVALETRGTASICIIVRSSAIRTLFARGYVSRVHVENCHIEGTTDFIFGPSIVLFECSTILCKADSFITASTTGAQRIRIRLLLLPCDGGRR